MFYKRIREPQKAFQCCKEIAQSIEEVVLRRVALQVLEENKYLYLSLKGSDWQHHNYAGGLIVHTCNVALNSIKLAEFYKDFVCMDLVKFGSLMHDVGKLFEYECQAKFTNDNNNTSINRALLGHSFEGASYISNKLKLEYDRKDILAQEDYAKNVITQATHCVGAHMNSFGACAKKQMLEVIIIGCADKIDAYLECTIVEDNQNSFVNGYGETIYRSEVSPKKVISCREY